MELFGTLGSPYVRRTAIALRALEVEFELVPLSVFTDLARFQQVNPVVKAPTLRLDDGTLLMDSSLIVQHFTTPATAESALLPLETSQRALALSGVSFALAACDKAVQIVYEHRLRPEEKQHQPWLERIHGQLEAACQQWETLAAAHPSEQTDLFTLTSAVVWTFIQRMLPDRCAPDNFPALEALTRVQEAKPLFRDFAMPEE